MPILGGHVVGHVVFTFYSLCQSLWGSSAAVDSILNSIDSQDDSLVALESATLHLSKPIIDEIGILDHKKFQENTDSSYDAADNDEVNDNPFGLSQQYPSQEKLKTYFKKRRSQKLSTRMGTEPQIFVKEDISLNRKSLEQLDKLDADFIEKVAKVGRTKYTISKVMQQFVGIMRKLAQVP